MRSPFAALTCAVALTLAAAGAARSQDAKCAGAKYSDSHFHLTNYVQEGPTAAEYVKMMGTTVCRSTLFGIPLQQEWVHGNSGDFAPIYYLQSDAPLYYYSFTDAVIAMEYRALPAEQQARLDPMITGFNPADMYAAAHIRRVLLTFPGVFSGIGEFTIHKEFVSSKIAGGPASLTDPALDSIFAFAAEAGLVVLMHNDVNMPFPKDGQENYIVAQLRELFLRHPTTTVIWAHIGLGRVVRPVPQQLAMIDRALSDPRLANVHIDISWDETAKYITSSPEAVAATAALINKYPDRFLFGSDVVAPASIASPVAVFDAYAPLWKALTPEANQKVRFGNYQRLFDAARVRVRAWEKANLGKPQPIPPPTPSSGDEVTP